MVQSEFLQSRKANDHHELKEMKVQASRIKEEILLSPRGSTLDLEDFNHTGFLPSLF
jgi:hypothetical protein